MWHRYTYAREDTHYLLYIYDKLRAELAPLGGEFVSSVWQRSADICRTAYKIHPFDADEHLSLIRRQVRLTPPLHMADTALTYG